MNGKTTVESRKLNTRHAHMYTVVGTSHHNPKSFNCITSQFVGARVNQASAQIHHNKPLTLRQSNCIHHHWLKLRLPYVLNSSAAAASFCYFELTISPTPALVDALIILQLLYAKKQTAFVGGSNKHTVMRKAISPDERLAVTLRYLATGNSFEDLKFSSYIAATTIREIVEETCDALCVCLKDYIKKPPEAVGKEAPRLFALLVDRNTDYLFLQDLWVRFERLAGCTQPETTSTSYHVAETSIYSFKWARKQMTTPNANPMTQPSLVKPGYPALLFNPPKSSKFHGVACLLILDKEIEDDINYVSYKSELQMPDIMRLIQKDLSEPYSIYTYRYFIHNWPKLCFLAMDENECVGAIVCKLDHHRKVVKRGYIAMLAVVLETEITNRPALRLYENLGFVRDKRLFRYYLNGVDALRLKLWLR
uniref:N-acetyltransferase domain-containing protein n=1 Tax=Timema douglasi TaxID=61478 RepID=A0A7R8VL73_TIMDO|nr:unnamed protein product [Timema douglasi]